MRFPLRWRILLFMVLPPVVLTGAALWMVNRTVTKQVIDGIHADLTRSSLVLENLLGARSEKLGLTARVIARDPRFFAALTLPELGSDPHVRATVKSVAQDFNRITHSDLFEVFDRRGKLLASVGRYHSSAKSRSCLELGEIPADGLSPILVEKTGHFQVAVMPVVVDRSVVGSLMLGAQIDAALARDLQHLTQSRVTFISGTEITGSTLESAAEREKLLQAIMDRDSPPLRATRRIGDGAGSFVTLVGDLPGGVHDTAQLYVMQRSLSAETAYLGGLQRSLMEMGGVAALAALFAALMTSGRITRRVKRLVRGAEEMKRGNYDYAIAIDSEDEIGYLAERFVEMRDRERVYVSSLEEVARVKSDFITIASHELRTPIAVIRGYHELMAGGGFGQLTPKQREALQVMESNLAILARIAEDAAWMAEIEGERPNLEEAPCEIEAVVAEAIRAATDEAPSRQVDVSYDVDPDLGPILADEARLTQAIANLVRNGIRFTPDEGFVRVVAQREEDELAIHVLDSGIGIKQEHAAQLFSHSVMIRAARNHHSSERLEFNSAGLGLGLAIARAIIEAHGGTIGIVSEPGCGSTFTLRLPLDDRELPRRQCA
jgi:signal transduction histidine kinase